MHVEAKREEMHKYLSVNDVDVRASRAEVAKGATHTGILYQQQIGTCWTEIHPFAASTTRNRHGQASISSSTQILFHTLQLVATAVHQIDVETQRARDK